MLRFCTLLVDTQLQETHTGQYAAPCCTGVCSVDLCTEAKRKLKEMAIFVLINSAALKIFDHCRTSFY